MSKATIFFSDNSELLLNKDSLITPIVLNTTSDQKFASMAAPISLHDHPINGLIPDIMTALCSCDFFYVD